MNQPVLWSVDPSADLLVSSLDYIETRLLKVVNVFKLCLYHVLHENDIPPFTNLTLNTPLVNVFFHKAKPTRVNIALLSLIRFMYLFVSTVFHFLLFQGKREYLDILHKYLEIHGTFFGVSVCFARSYPQASSPASITNIELIL